MPKLTKTNPKIAEKMTDSVTHFFILPIIALVLFVLAIAAVSGTANKIKARNLSSAATASINENCDYHLGIMVSTPNNLGELQNNLVRYCSSSYREKSGNASSAATSCDHYLGQLNGTTTSSLNKELKDNVITYCNSSYKNTSSRSNKTTTATTSTAAEATASAAATNSGGNQNGSNNNGSDTARGIAGVAGAAMAYQTITQGTGSAFGDVTSGAAVGGLLGYAFGGDTTGAAIGAGAGAIAAGAASWLGSGSDSASADGDTASGNSNSSTGDASSAGAAAGADWGSAAGGVMGAIGSVIGNSTMQNIPIGGGAYLSFINGKLSVHFGNQKGGQLPTGSLSVPATSKYNFGTTIETSLRQAILKWTNWFLGFFALIAMIAIIYSGFMYVTARGEQEQADKGKKGIAYATIGIIVVLLAYAFVDTIITTGPSGTDLGASILLD